MGLFVNKQQVCPVCNKPTPRIFPTLIDGVPICRECAGKIDLPDGAAAQMSLESFRKYLIFYEQNRKLRDIFTESCRVDFTASNAAIILDTVHRLFRLKGTDTSLVLEASDLRAFRILEDNVPLFEGEGNILRCHSGEVPARVKSMAPQVARFLMQQEMYERMGRIERENSERARMPHYESGLNFNAPVPFKHFYVELALMHPYWGGFRGKLDAPGFNRYSPNVDAYMRDYQEKADKLHTLAVNLMQMIDPNAQEVRDADNAPAAVQTVSAEDTAHEIKRYKTLLDAGIITEEEFTAKKRLLLGI